LPGFLFTCSGFFGKEKGNGETKKNRKFAIFFKTFVVTVTNGNCLAVKPEKHSNVLTNARVWMMYFFLK